MRAPDCKIFVDADLSQTEIIGLVGEVLLAESESVCEADIAENEDYDPQRRRLFPHGFIYFRYTIDLYCDQSPLKSRIGLTSRLLEQLWAWGFPAVAACSYEDHLPHGGGYKSSRVPWVV
jgi:hypothetical protein